MLSYLSPSWRQCLAASYRSHARRCPRGFLSRFHAEETVVEHELYDLFGLVGGYTRATEVAMRAILLIRMAIPGKSHGISTSRYSTMEVSNYHSEGREPVL